MEKYRSTWENKLVNHIIEHQLNRWDNEPRTQALADDINDRIAGAWKMFHVLKEDWYLHDYNKRTNCPIKEVMDYTNFIDGPYYYSREPLEKYCTYFHPSEKFSNTKINCWLDAVQLRITKYITHIDKYQDTMNEDELFQMRYKIEHFINVMVNVTNVRHAKCPIVVEM